MAILFDTVRDLNQDILRNIVKILPPNQAFSDLIEDNTDIIVAEKAIHSIHTDILDNQHFHYSAAIGFPFETDNFMASRFSDGTFPVWYGSLDNITTIYETTHHMIKTEMAIEGVENRDMITRERVIYDVRCEGILIDLTRKKKYFPELISENYRATQKIGKRLTQQGYPGLLSPSARNLNGINANIFKPEILNQPRVNCYLTYQLYPHEKIIRILKKNRNFMEISW